MKTQKSIRLLSALLCIAMLFALLPMGVISSADAQEQVYLLSKTELLLPTVDASGCTHEHTEITSYPSALGGNCTVKCSDCGSSSSFGTSTGMYNWWNHDGSMSYYSPLNQSEYSVGEKLYLWITDLNDGLVPDEKIITIEGGDGVTFTETWTQMGYFTFCKPGVYTVTIADRYNPRVCYEYTMKVVGNNGSSGEPDDGSCAHQYTSAVTPASCLVQGYTTYTCSKCARFYLDDYTDPLGHSYTNYLSNGDGALTAVCDRCDATDTIRDENSNIVPSERTATQIMLSLKDEYPEGMTWTNDNYYGWQGGIFSGGYGCAGFCFLLSDAIFGDLPARVIEGPVTIDQLRVGDILRINNDTHSVSVLEVYEDYIVLAEGNFNSSIHWGRTLSADQIAVVTDYIMTRYPENTHVHNYTATVTAPTCTEQGYTTYACACGDSYVGSYTSATGHNYGAWAQTKAPTCTEKGSDRRDCAYCDAYETREVEALGHEMGEWVVTVEPDAENEGAKRRDCANCDYYETEVIPAKGEGEEAGLPGDADGDGRITLRDAVMIQQYLNGWDVEVDTSVADVDGDGILKLKDAVIIQQYLNGWDVELV